MHVLSVDAGADEMRRAKRELRHLAADVMRLTGHPEQAAEVLRRAISAHPGDGRLSVASFTLGRVLLHQLGRPRAAAAGASFRGAYRAEATR